MLELSVIIPIYNTPPDALQRCFDSVATLQDIRYEVLLIDDGSRPNTGQYCRNYAAQHAGFRYFYQENSGVSSARNTGLQKAQGRYVTFLDADDALLGHSITTSLLSHNHALVVFDLLLIKNQQQSVWHALNETTGLLTQSVLLAQLITSKSLNSPCGKLFLLDIIREHGLEFDTSFVTGEDWNFICDFVLQIPEAYYHRQPAYCYYRDGSTSLSRLERFPEKMLSNPAAMLQRKQELLQLPCLASDARLLTGIATASYLEDLFNTTANLMLMGKMPPQRKAWIREQAACTSNLLQPQSPKKARAKALILKRFWFAIRPLAHIRRLYLKLKQ